MIMKSYVRQSVAALRLLLILSIVLGVLYPLAVTAIAQVPGLSHNADGSLISRNGHVVGSTLLGQSFTDAKGRPLPQYFQTRPSSGGYDPTASGASNLGPESVQDAGTGAPSLLTQVCTRSLEIGRFDGVDGRRPYCTVTGVGAVLRVLYAQPGYRGAITRVVSVNQPCPATPFLRTYRGVAVQCAAKGADYAAGKVALVRGAAPSRPAVPADAVTASGSGLDPHISPAYARIQETRVARTRGVTEAEVAALVRRYTDARDLGVLGEARVNVLRLNLALDRLHTR
jgi:potassium-transporting ATPase KdpC subunit